VQDEFKCRVESGGRWCIELLSVARVETGEWWVVGDLAVLVQPNNRAEPDAECGIAMACPYPAATPGEPASRWVIRRDRLAWLELGMDGNAVP
jgi:hypothetical protein